MKQAFSIITVAFLLAMFSCKKELNKSMTIVRDCTGTYLRLDGKDYHVCNREKISSFADGTKVTVTFNKIENCTNSDETAVCYMLHENEGWVEIVKVK